LSHFCIAINRSAFGLNLQLCGCKNRRTPYYRFVIRATTALIGAVCLVTSLSASAAPAKIKKVLTFYLDQQGRQSLSPSLYERDAYQAELRNNPTNRSALRFDIQWNTSAGAPLKLRVEMRGAKGMQNTTATIEATVRKRRLFSRWTQLALAGEDYQKFGELVAWRATLWQGDIMIAEQKSFLW
jgi:hypothetical protein